MKSATQRRHEREVQDVLDRVQDDTGEVFDEFDMARINPAEDTWVEVADKLRGLIVRMADEDRYR